MKTKKILLSVEKGNRCLNNRIRKKNQDIRKQFIDIFGKGVWDASLEIDKIKSFITKKLKDMEDQEKIDLVEVDWIDPKKYSVIGVFEFLERLVSAEKTRH